MSNSNDNNRSKRRAEIDLEGPAARRPFSGNMTSGHMSGPGHMTGPGHMSGIFGPPSPGAGSYAPVPSASPPQTPAHPGLIDVREGPNNGGEVQFPPFSRGSTPVPHQVSFAQAFTQPRSPGAMTMNGPAPQRGQAAPERGDRAGSVASVTSVTSRNGPPIVNPSLPNLPPDGLVVYSLPISHSLTSGENSPNHSSTEPTGSRAVSSSSPSALSVASGTSTSNFSPTTPLTSNISSIPSLSVSPSKAHPPPPVISPITANLPPRPPQQPQPKENLSKKSTFPTSNPSSSPC